MTVTIVEADVKRDISLFVSLLNRNRNHSVGSDRFEWLYLNNPHGKARVWLVVDKKSNEPVAFTCALPRLMSIESKRLVCWNCGDFSVDKKYRTLGVALKLRRKAKECVDHGEIPALYAHPNDRMKLIHEKVGHAFIGEMQRYVKLLKVDSQVQKRIKNNMIAHFITFFVNALIYVVDEFLFDGGDSRYRIKIYKDSLFGDEFDELNKKSSHWYSLIGDRSSQYLNWRYHDNPLQSYERLVVRREGQLVGYIIYMVEGRNAVFKDILCDPNSDLYNVMVCHWIKSLRQRGIDSISSIFMNSNPVIRVFEKYGFKKRPEVSSVYGYSGDKSDLSEIWNAGDKWYMTVGDRDV